MKVRAALTRARRAAVALATMPVVHAVASAAPSVATAANDSSTVARHPATRAQNTRRATTARDMRIKAGNDITDQYRHFATPAPAVPLIFLQHYRGALDHWDPKIIDTIAAKRQVILADSVGGSSTPARLLPRRPSGRGDGPAPNITSTQAAGSEFLQRLGRTATDREAQLTAMP
ncbi:hypothetical protein [Streptomyces sp. IBSBF 2806]|uniref:hypothetical protein n=1 Tax=Streptomyces sp. IBSBF 2806 TaxID=2903529 RepID=UPI002FDC2FF7